VAGGSGEVGAGGAEDLGAGQRAHAAGDLDAELAHPDDLLSFIVVERNLQVMGEPQVVVGAVAHPGREGVPFVLQLAAAGGVQDDPGISRLAEPPALLFEDLRVDGPAAGACGFLQFQQRVDGLLRQSTSSSVPVSVTAVSSRSKWASHRACPATPS
jgi:hypothetical protein